MGCHRLAPWMRYCLGTMGVVWALAAGPAPCPTPAASADDFVPRASVKDLQGTLEKSLRARRPEEFRFIARVVSKVRDGTLPRSMVESTFQWARKRPHHPFQYFERALRIRARRIGVAL